MKSDSISYRWGWIVVTAGLLALLAGGAWFYCSQEQFARRAVEANLSVIAQSKADEIARWRAERLGQAGVLMSSPFFAEGVAHWLANPQAESEQKIRVRLRAIQQSTQCADVVVMDRAGQVRWRLSEQSSPLDSVVIEAAATVFRTRQPVLTDLHKLPTDSVPYLWGIAPLFADVDAGKEPVGAIVLQFDARQFLYPLIQSWSMASATAETLLVRREGDSVLFLNELRHRQDTAFKVRFPLSRREIPAVQAALGHEGVFRGKDYRGVKVLSVLKQIPDTPWALVAKIDAAEALAEWRFRAILIVALVLALMLALGAAVYAVVQQRAKYRALAQSDAVLRESEEKFRNLAAAARDAVILINSEGRIVFWNAAAEAMFGYAQVEVIGRSVHDLLAPPHHQPDALAGIMRFAATGDGSVIGKTLELAGRRKDGTEFPIELSVAATAVQGQWHAIGIARDITARKRTELLLQQERDKAKQYLNVVEVILVALDTQGRVTLLNRKGYQVLGYAEGELRGRNWFDVVVPPEESQAVFGEYQKIMSGELRRVEYYENHVRTKTGEKRLIAWHNHVLQDEAGRIIGTLSSGEDITERRRLEEQFRQAQKMEVVGHLAGGVAHDFNNLLNVIIGYSEMTLAKMDPASPFFEHISQVLKAGERAAVLTRQLLAFSRKQIMEPKILDLNALVTNLHKMLRRLVREDIEIVLALSPAPVCVKADPGQIEQVITNMVVNARDAMPRGGKLTIVTGNITLGHDPTRPDVEPGEYVRLSIRDTGTGMTDAVKGHLFEPFFTTKPVGQGTGLGLATCFGIVKQSDGHIAVESEVGQGTTFHIYLPRVAENAVVAAGPQAGGTLPRGQETILLVEDEPAVREVAEMMLADLGYKVLVAADGKEALRLVQETGAVDLLITDVVMPEMNGRQLAGELRQRCPQLKVLFISGYTANAIVHQGVLDPGVAFLQKPFLTYTLARKVREVLDAPAP